MNLRAHPLPPPFALPTLSRLLLAGVLGALAATSAGCADPEASLDAFSERYDKNFANKPPTACPETYVPLTAGAADGQYLLVLSVALKPDAPLVFLADVTTPALGTGVGLGLTITALDKLDRQTPVDAPRTFEPVAVDDSGGFELSMTALSVVAAANTIVNVPVEADALLKGSVCGDASFVCGDVTGAVVSPKANLEGSTFTLIRIENPDKYPEPLLDCEQTPAAPFP